MKKSFILTFFILSTTIAFGQLQAWDFNASSNAPTANAPGVSGSNAIFNGVGSSSYVTGFNPFGDPPPMLAYASDGWTTSASIDATDYFEITVNATGDNLDFSDLELVMQRDADGPQQVAITTSADGYASIFHSVSLVNENFTGVSVNLQSAPFTNLSSLTIRFHGYNATSSAGLLVFDEIAFKQITVLPVELAYLTGAVNDNATSLEWATFSELNNAYYEVQHSTNGHGFETIGLVEGGGSTSEYLVYDFIHDAPVSGMNYYRLRQVDFDGQTSYSDIITVEYKAIVATDVKVFPNPVVSWVEVQLPQLDFDSNVTIYNANGQVMREMIVSSFDNNVRLEVEDWTNGIYFIRIQTNNNQVVTKQFIKF